jgi:WD40 repeat protein
LYSKDLVRSYDLFTYKVFLSYSRQADQYIAAALQSGLQTFAKPMTKVRAIRVFRDATALTPSLGLWSDIERNLRSSEFFILLACAASARSAWVCREVQWWIANGRQERLLIVLTDGVVSWDNQKEDFDWSVTDGLPEILAGKLREEPNYVDLRWAKGMDGTYLKKDPRFRDNLADLSSVLRGIDKESLIGEDILNHRRFTRLRTVAIAALAILSIGEGATAFVAHQQRNRAEENASRAQNNATQARTNEIRANRNAEIARAKEAEANRQRHAAEENLLMARRQEQIATTRRIVAEAELARGEAERTENSALLAAQAVQRMPLPEAETALRDTLYYLPKWLAQVPVRGWVRVIRFSPDGQYMAIGTEPEGMNGDETTSLQVIKVSTMERIADIRHSGFISDIEFSPNSQLIVSIGAMTGARVVRTHDGSTVGSLVLPTRQESVAFDPVGNSLILAGEDGQIRCLNASTWEEKWSQAASQSTWAIKFSPDGRYVGLGGQDKRCRVLDALTGSILLDREADQQSFAFSPDSKALVSGAMNGGIKLFEAGSWRLINERMQDGPVGVVAFSPEGNYFATGSTDGAVRVFSTQLKLKSSFFTGERQIVMDLAFSPDSKIIGLVAGNSARLFEADTGNELLRTGGNSLLRSIAFSPNGGLLAVGGHDEKATVFRARPDPKEFQSFEHLGELSSPAVLSPNGTRIAGALKNGPLFVFDRATGREIWRSNSRNTLTDVEWAPQGSSLVYFDNTDGRIRAFNFDLKREMWSSEKTKQDINCLTFSRDGKYVAAAGWKDVVVYEAPTGKPVCRMPAGQVPFSVAFSHNGRLLAVAGADTHSYVFEIPSGKLARDIDYQASGSAIAFSPDDSVIVTARGDRSIRMTRVGTGTEVRRIADVGMALSMVVDGERIATGGKDHSVRIFEANTGRLISRFDLGRPVWRVSLGPKSISTTEGFGILRTHTLDRSELLREACARVMNNFSPIEWRTYFGNEPYSKTCPSRPVGADLR